MELRLCDYLRHQVPRIFDRDRTPIPSSTVYQESHGGGGSSHRHHAYHNHHQQPQPQPHEQITPVGERQSSVSSVTSQGEHPHHRYQETRSSAKVADKWSSVPPEKAIWSGQLARNGSKFVDTSAVAINGQCESFLTQNVNIINITHRLKWEEASKGTPVAVFYLKAQHSRDIDTISEYIRYFQQKQRIGVAPLDGGSINIYICAPGTELYDRYNIGQQQRDPILICIAIQNTNQRSAAPSSSPPPSNAQPQQEDRHWLNQLNTITAMLGTNV